MSILPSTKEKPWPLTMSGFVCFQWYKVLFSWVDRNGLAKLSRLRKDLLYFAVAISMCAFNNFFFSNLDWISSESRFFTRDTWTLQNGQNLHLPVNKRTSSNEENFLKQRSRQKDPTSFSELEGICQYINKNMSIKICQYKGIEVKPVVRLQRAAQHCFISWFITWRNSSVANKKWPLYG